MILIVVFFLFWKWGVYLDSQSSHLAHDHLGHEVISLTDDSYSKRVFENSFNERASSLESFKALLSDDTGEGGHTDVHMTPRVLFYGEIQASKLMRERIDDFVQAY